MIGRIDDGPVRRLRLDRPPSNNLNGALLKSLSDELRAAAADASVRCVTLESALPRYFSAGIDLEDVMKRPEAERGEAFERLLGVHRELTAFPKPTVAVLGGTAILGGWILAMGCDFRLLADSGKVALSEIRLGLSPSAALIRRLLSIGAHPRAVKELVLRGRTLRGEEALAGGLVDRLVPAADLEAEALAEAKSLARMAPTAYAAVKRDLAFAQSPDDDALWADSLKGFERLLAGPEAREGMAAMNEKRRPRWEASCS